MGRNVRVETATLDTPRGGHMLAMKALVEGMLGKYDVALELCNEAHLILEAVTASHTKRGADLLMVKAFVLANTEKVDELTHSQALANYSSAVSIMEEFNSSDIVRTSWKQPSEIRAS